MTKKQKHEAYFGINKEELEVENWETLSEEELYELKENLLSTKYGRGGEHLNLFPNLIDPGKINREYNGEYLQKLPKTINQQSLKEFQGNGKVEIFRIESLNHSHYLVLLLPEKTIEVDIWSLTMNDQPPYTKYKGGNKIKTIKVPKNRYHITNLFSNGSKAVNQARRLSHLFGLGDTNFLSLERVKKGGRNNYNLDIDDTGGIILRNGINGPTYSSLDELVGRKHSLDLNIMEFLG